MLDAGRLRLADGTALGCAAHGLAEGAAVASVRLERVLPMTGWRAGCWRWPIPAEAVRVFPANPP